MHNNSGSFAAVSILTCALLALIALSFIRVSLPDMRASDDNVWLYSAGRALTDTRNVHDPERELAERVRAAGAAPEATFRYELRLGYRQNYFLPLHVWGWAASAIDAGAEPSLPAYADKVASAIIAGAIASHALAALVLALGILLMRRADLAAAALGGLAILFALTFAVRSGAAFLFWEEPGPRAFVNAVQFALHPDAQYTVFGFTPRSQMGLLVLLAFLLRWRGWLGASYATLALSGLVHQSMATLIFAIVLVMDLLLRPAALRQRAVLPFVVLGLLLIAMRETLWNYMMTPRAFIGVGLGIAAIGIGAVLLLRASRAGYLEWVEAKRARLASYPLYAIDALLLGGGWLLTLPLGYLLARLASPMQRLYFWDQVHSRSWLLIAPVVAAAVVLGLLHRFERSAVGQRWSARPATLALIASLLVLLPFVVGVKPISAATAQISRLHQRMQALGGKLALPLDHVPTIDDEAVLYLGAARQRDSGEPMVQRLIPLSGPAAH